MTNLRLHMRPLALWICAAALACTATAVPAQAVFKHVNIAGHITYTDLPETIASAQAAEIAELAPIKAPPRTANISSRRVAAQVDANEATLRLRKAQQQRKQGSQPLAGERSGATAANAVNYRYWRRQEKLRIAVEQAQRRSNETGKLQLAQR